MLGLGHPETIGDDELPSSIAPVSLGNVPVVELEASVVHVCVRHDDGTMRCWGGNDYGQLGYGNTTIIGDDELPSSVGPVDVGGSIDELAVGRFNTFVRIGTDVKCWGAGVLGGNGSSPIEDLGDDEVPASYGTIDLGFNVTALSTGSLGASQCARSDALLRCWGANESGQLGYGDTLQIGDDEAPSAVGPVSYL